MRGNKRMMFPSFRSILLASFISVLALFATTSSVFAQQVLICRNLHNDLANFDRRASTLGTGGTRTMGTSPQALFHVPDPTSALACSGQMIASGSCHPDRPDDPVSPMAAEWENDPVRLRLIELMQKYHCQPLEAYAEGPFDAQGVSKQGELETTVRAKY